VPVPVPVPVPEPTQAKPQLETQPESVPETETQVQVQPAPAVRAMLPASPLGAREEAESLIVELHSRNPSVTEEKSIADVASTRHHFEPLTQQPVVVLTEAGASSGATSPRYHAPTPEPRVPEPTLEADRNPRSEPVPKSEPPLESNTGPLHRSAATAQLESVLEPAPGSEPEPELNTDALHQAPAQAQSEPALAPEPELNTAPVHGPSVAASAQAPPSLLAESGVRLDAGVVTYQPRPQPPPLTIKPSAAARNDKDLRAAIDASRRRAPPAVVPGPLRTRSLLTSLGPDSHREGRTQRPGEPPARVFIRETVFDTIVDSLRKVDPVSAAAGPAAQLHKAVAAAAENSSAGESNPRDGEESPASREVPNLGAKLAAIAAMRDSLYEGLWALHEERPADPLPFLIAKLHAQANAQTPQAQHGPS
jgi:hypothetical protein